MPHDDWEIPGRPSKPRRHPLEEPWDLAQLWNNPTHSTGVFTGFGVVFRSGLTPERNPEPAGIRQ